MPGANARQPAAPVYADRLDLGVYQDAEGNLCPVRTCEDVGRRQAHTLANMQRVMGPLPGPERRVPLDIRWGPRERAGGCTRQRLSFAAEPGDRVPAYLCLPAEAGDWPPERRRPAMLCLHQTTACGKAEPAGLAGLPNLHYACELAARGYVTLAPDYPGYGEYPVDPYALGYASATMKGIWNHARALDLLQALPQVDSGRLGCIGHSLGGHNALFLAAFDGRVRVTVTSCGFNSFAWYCQGDLTGWSHRGYMPRIAAEYGARAERLPFDFAEVLGAIAPRALFVNAPLHDDNFAIDGVQACLRAVAPLYRLCGDPADLGAAHPCCGHDFPPTVREAAYAFVDRVLRAP